MGILLNAEGLPIESIDRIQISLNQKLNTFINHSKKFIDNKNYLRIWSSNNFGIRWFMDIQAQKINPFDIRGSIAGAVFEAINKGFIEFPTTLPFQFIYTNLDFFVINIRQIEFAFDFKPEAINVIDKSLLQEYKGTLYSNDYRYRVGRQTRKSFIDLYNRIPYLKKTNKISHKIIDANPYSYRLEFLLIRNNNSKWLAMDNIMGSYHDVILRHIPYLAIIYHNHFYKKIEIDVSHHPYFAQIYASAAEDKKRYTGDDLEKTKSHKSTQNEDNFYACMNMMEFSAKMLASQALFDMEKK